MGAYVKEIGRVSGQAMGWLRSNYCVLHMHARGLRVGRYPPQPFSVLGPAPTMSPSFLLAQAIFELNLFPYKYPNILKTSHPSYISSHEDGTDRVFRNVGI